MTTLEATLLSNAILVLPLALAAALVTRCVRHPAVAWALWGIVLLKFVTPGFVPFSVPAELSDSNQGHETEASQDSLLEENEPAERTSPSAVPVRDSAVQMTDQDTGPAALPPDQGERLEDLAATAPPLLEQVPVPLASEIVVTTEFDDAEQPKSRPPAPSEPIWSASMPFSLDATESAESSLLALDESDLPLPATDAPSTPVTTVPTGETSADVGAARGTVTSLIEQAALWRAVGWRLWIGGGMIVALLCSWRALRFHRLLQQAAPAPAEIVSLAKSLIGPIKIRRMPELRTTSGRVPPLLWAGFGRPTILLPLGLWESLNDDGRRALLAHELTHVARRDHWTRWLEMTVRCLYWWHPVAWWAGRRLREAEEQCCDAQVVALAPGSAKAYARAVMATVDFLADDSQPVPVLATGLRPLRRSVRPLQRRLTMIVHETTSPKSSWLSRLLLLGAAACVLPATLVAEPDDEEESAPSTSGPVAVELDGFGLNQVDDETFSFYVGVDEVRDESFGAASDETQAAPPEPAGPLTPAGGGDDDVAPGNPPLGGKPRPSGKRVNVGVPGVTGLAGRWAAQIEPAEPVRPEALTSPEDYEEISVVAQGYVLPANLAQAVQEFLRTVEAGFPVLVTAIRNVGDGSFGGEDYGAFDMEDDAFGSEGYGGGFPGMMGMPYGGKVTLWVIAPATVEEAIGGFLKAMQDVPSGPDDSRKITLVRARYSMPADAVKAFAELVRAYQQSGLVIPLVVKTEGTKLTLTAPKQVHENIRQFVTFLGEHWKTASVSHSGKADHLDDVAESSGTSSRIFRTLGLGLAPLSGKDIDRTRGRYRGGLQVTAVIDSTPAADAGIRLDDVLVGLGAHETTSLQDVGWILNQAPHEDKSRLKFFILRDGETLFGRLNLAGQGLTVEPPGAQPAPQAKPVTEAAGPGAAQAVSHIDFEIAQREVDLAMEKLAFTKRLVEKGLKPTSDVKSADMELLKAERTLTQLEGELSPASMSEEYREWAGTRAGQQAIRGLLKALVDSVDMTKPRHEAAAELLREIQRRKNLVATDQPELLEMLAHLRDTYELVNADLQARSKNSS